MKTLILSLILFLICFELLGMYAVLAQTELPEPGPLDIKYECQILWGTIATNSVWVSQPITFTIADGDVGTVHKYSGKLGIQNFEATAIGYDAMAPKKVLFSFPITTLPDDGFNVHFYRVRIRGFVTNPDGGDAIVGTWSGPSYWVVIYVIKTPGNPIGK